MEVVERVTPDTLEARLARERRVISRALNKLLAPGPDIQLTLTGEAQRIAVEAFIADRFFRHHRARITSFLPALLNIRCNGHHTAALGLHPAGKAPLFLEQYLDQPAEQAVAAVVKTPVARNHIVEIGNLVSTFNGATALLYLVLLATVHRAGFPWVMFTATPEVRRSIEKLGFRISPVCEADPARLANPEEWGTYYDVRPQVMVGHVEDSFRSCLDNRLLESVLELTRSTVTDLADKLVRLTP